MAAARPEQAVVLQDELNANVLDFMATSAATPWKPAASLKVGNASALIMATNAARWRLTAKPALTGAVSPPACAREFAALGADVLMVARDETHLEQASVDLTEEFPERDSPSPPMSPNGSSVWKFSIGSPNRNAAVVGREQCRQQRKGTLDYSEDEVRGFIETKSRRVRNLPSVASALERARECGDRSVGSVSGTTHVRNRFAWHDEVALMQLTRNLACEWAADGIHNVAVAYPHAAHRRVVRLSRRSPARTPLERAR